MQNSSKRHYLLKNLEQQEMAEKLMGLFETSDFDDSSSDQSDQSITSRNVGSSSESE